MSLQSSSEEVLSLHFTDHLMIRAWSWAEENYPVENSERNFATLVNSNRLEDACSLMRDLLANELAVKPCDCMVEAPECARCHEIGGEFWHWKGNAHIHSYCFVAYIGGSR